VGRDASPEPLAVNQAAWEVQKALLSYPETYFVVGCGLCGGAWFWIVLVCDSVWFGCGGRQVWGDKFQRPTTPHLPPQSTPTQPTINQNHTIKPKSKIHCTHGFNRTGYVIACLMMRLLAATGMCVERAARRFAAQRPPGIYKHQYLEDLFRYHREARPAGARTPAVPEWKGPDTPGGDDDGDGGDDGLDAAAAAAAGGGGGGNQQQHMSHDDKFGEVVPDEEREWLANQVYDAIVLQGMVSDFFKGG
jgi:hypothetical protein